MVSRSPTQSGLAAESSLLKDIETPKLDLVIPVYNEAHVLEQSTICVSELMVDCDLSWQIVIVDNSSTDGTREIGLRLAEERDNVSFLRLEEKGRGRALRKTWNETDADISIYMDVDLSTELSAVKRVVDEILDGADLVTGSRLHPESNTQRCLKREFLSRSYNRLIRWVLGKRSFDDVQCGFKGVRVKTIRPLLRLVENQNWFFDTELMVLAEFAGLDVRHIPISWVEDSDSRVNIPKTVWEDLKGLARLRLSLKQKMQEWEEIVERDSASRIP